MIAQFLISLCFIVGVHELGHLLFAKAFGMRVESYTIGFPPKLLRKKWGETEYALGALPLGGAVTISGMFNETSTSAPTQPNPWEFRSKPAWQRLVVILGGIALNLLVGTVLYMALTLHLGDPYLSREELNVHGVLPSPEGYAFGFREGDRIETINGKQFERFEDLYKPSALLADGAYFTVRRAGKQMRIELPADFIEARSTTEQSEVFLQPLLPFVVGSVDSDSPAFEAGLRPGDAIVAVDDHSVGYLHHLRQILSQKASGVVQLTCLREGMPFSVAAKVSGQGTLGFTPRLLLEYSHKRYRVGEAAALAVRKVGGLLHTNATVLCKTLSGRIPASKALSGPIGIAQVFGKTFDWTQFWNITAFLSVVIAFTNLLPIPALDGGHALWILYELVTGRRVSDVFLERIQKAGAALLAILLCYAVANDLYKLF